MPHDSNEEAMKNKTHFSMSLIAECHSLFIPCSTSSSFVSLPKMTKKGGGHNDVKSHCSRSGISLILVSNQNLSRG